MKGTDAFRSCSNSVVQCIIPSTRDNEHGVVLGKIQMLHVFKRILLRNRYGVSKYRSKWEQNSTCPSERINESPELFMDRVLVVR